jgi:hypothetical protein
VVSSDDKSNIISKLIKYLIKMESKTDDSYEIISTRSSKHSSAPNIPRIPFAKGVNRVQAPPVVTGGPLSLANCFGQSPSAPVSLTVNSGGGGGVLDVLGVKFTNSFPSTNPLAGVLAGYSVVSGNWVCDPGVFGGSTGIFQITVIGTLYTLYISPLIAVAGVSNAPTQNVQRLSFTTDISSLLPGTHLGPSPICVRTTSAGTVTGAVVLQSSPNTIDILDSAIDSAGQWQSAMPAQGWSGFHVSWVQ